MQSYSSFSVGGTLSVNAHGITTDHCLAESVLSFRIVLADGRELNCSRDSEDEETRELFGLALGGYGLFGVILEAPFLSSFLPSLSDSDSLGSIFMPLCLLLSTYLFYLNCIHPPLSHLITSKCSMCHLPLFTIYISMNCFLNKF